MTGEHVKIKAAEGGEFDCYVAAPSSGPAPAAILVCSVMGVDEDFIGMTDDLAARGILAASPDMFWRTIPGPLPRSDERARERAQPRIPLIEQGVQDIADTLAYVKAHPACNGKVAVIGFCYGGPYAILGPARLGCDAGISFHGTTMDAFIGEVDKVKVPLSIHWGDEDHAAPPEIIAQYGAKLAGHPNADMTIYPGIKHGYTAKSAPAFDADTSRRSWDRAQEILDGLKG